MQFFEMCRGGRDALPIGSSLEMQKKFKKRCWVEDCRLNFVLQAETIGGEDIESDEFLK